MMTPLLTVSLACLYRLYGAFAGCAGGRFSKRLSKSDSPLKVSRRYTSPILRFCSA